MQDICRLFWMKLNIAFCHTVALCNKLRDMTLHHSMKGCHVGKGGGTQLKLGSLWLLAMMVLIDLINNY